MARKAQSVSSSHGAYPNREQIGSFLWELWGRHLYHLPAFMLKGRPCGRCQHPFLQVLRRVWHPYMAGVWRPCCTLTVMENLGMDPWMGPKFVVRGLTVGWCNSLEIGDIYIYICMQQMDIFKRWCYFDDKNSGNQVPDSSTFWFTH